MTQNRKRGRNCHEDEVEFMPLSKRINNLHINNSLLMDNSNNMNHVGSSLGGGVLTEWGPGPPIYPGMHQNLPESPPSSEQSLDWSLPPQYSPDLTENQNPHYYSINKLLFQMYVERSQRGGT